MSKLLEHFIKIDNERKKLHLKDLRRTLYNAVFPPHAMVCVSPPCQVKEMKRGKRWSRRKRRKKTEVRKR